MRKHFSLLLSGLLLFQGTVPVLADEFEEVEEDTVLRASSEEEGKKDFESLTLENGQERAASIYEAARAAMAESAALQPLSDEMLEALVHGVVEDLPVPRSAAALPGNNQKLTALKKKIRELEAKPSTAAVKKELEALYGQLEAWAAAPVYRLYNPNSGEHFYTPSAGEKEVLVEKGWKDEGIGWQSLTGNQSVPVYRLYNPNAGDHHYTCDEKERDALTEKGWLDENVAWYASPENGVPVFRTYNPNARQAGAHHLTMDENEYTTLGQNGWANEGVSFYVPSEMGTYTIEDETMNGRSGIVFYDQSGNRLSGSRKIDGSWYYFEPETGFMLQNTVFQAPDAEDYRLYGHDGKAVKGSFRIGGQSFAFAGENGYLVRNKNIVKADGSYYLKNSDGSLSNQPYSKGGVSFYPDADGKVEKVVHENLPRYMQSDPRWADERFAHCKFKGLGCLPTVMCSVLNAFGGQACTPLEVGRLLEANQFLSGDLFGRLPVGGVQEGIVWLAQQYNLMIMGNMSEAQMKQVLLQGGLIAFDAGKPPFADASYTHEILLYGYDHGKVMVHDPLYPENSGVYPLSDLYKIRCLSVYGTAAGGPVFGFLNPHTGVAVE